MPGDVLLTSREAAGLLRVHPKQLYRLLRRGLPARRVGSEWRFSREEILAWSEQREVRSPSRAAPPPLVAANGDVAIEILLAQVGELGLMQADHDDALAKLVDGTVVAAGLHGAPSPRTLGDRKVAILDLVEREIGLAFPASGSLRSASEVVGRRLASRPKSAGVRGHLDRALSAEGVDSEALHRLALELDSHRDAVLAVVRGEADVAVASRAWASRAGLSFLRLTTERYGLVVFSDDLGDPRVVRLGEHAQSSRYRDALRGVPGYDTTHTGNLRFTG